MTTVEGGGERGEAGVKGEIIKSKRTRTAFVPFFFFFPPYRLALLEDAIDADLTHFHRAADLRAWLFFMPVSPRRELLSIDPELVLSYCTIRAQFSPKKFEGTIFSIRNKRNPPPLSRFLSRENKRGVILIITFWIKTHLIEDRKSDNGKILKDFSVIQLIKKN